MTRKIILLWMSAWVVTTAGASGYEIKIRLESAPNEKITLAHYFGSGVFVDDTVRTNFSGEAVFQGDSLLPQGLYKIYLNADKHFDFLLGADQRLTITNPGFSLEGMQMEGAPESVEFLKYMYWLKERQALKQQLDKQREGADAAGKAAIEEKLHQLSKEVSDYWKKKNEEYPGTFLAAFLMANYYEEPDESKIPPEIAAIDSLKWLYLYNYRKNHYFDYFRLTDERLLFTPLIKNKLETYFERVILQTYDSVKQAAYQVLHQVEPHKKMFQFVTAHLLNSTLNSKVMGMDALFVDIARDYYLSGRAFWADSTTVDKIRENVIFLQDNLIGKQARDIHLQTHEGEFYSFYQSTGKFTLLVFYEPNCSHCREYVPQLYQEVYLPFRDKGLEVVAVYTMNDKAEWTGFLENHQLNDWVNAWDEHHVSRFKIIYDTRTTPAVYLLDRSKKIVAKKCTIEFLKDYLSRNLSR